MKILPILLATSLLCSIAGASTLSTMETKTEKTHQVIILKLDDLVVDHDNEELPVSSRWQRLTDFLKKSNIKASYGIIGYALEEDNPDFFKWIKTLHDDGLIEFWNHGYKNKKTAEESGEFENNSVKKQLSTLKRTQVLAKQKLGFDLHVFGAHWSGVNEATIQALSTIPEIHMIYYEPIDTTRFVFKYVMTLEDPPHVPNFAKFKTTYEKKAKNEACLALQGHPNSWDDERWEEFLKIIQFLQSKGVVFMTPSEYTNRIE